MKIYKNYLYAIYKLKYKTDFTGEFSFESPEFTKKITEELKNLRKRPADKAAEMLIFLENEQYINNYETEYLSCLVLKIFGNKKIDEKDLEEITLNTFSLRSLRSPGLFIKYSHDYFEFYKKSKKEKTLESLDKSLYSPNITYTRTHRPTESINDILYVLQLLVLARINCLEKSYPSIINGEVIYDAVCEIMEDKNFFIFYKK